MQFRAEVRNEGTSECPWFVYTYSSNALGGVYACRFGSRREANRVMRAMNESWRREGRLLVREEEVAA
jgi:hypothetical protein